MLRNTVIMNRGFQQGLQKKTRNIRLATNGIYSTALWLITFKMIYTIVGLGYNSIRIVLSVTFFYRFGGGKPPIKRAEDL